MKTKGFFSIEAIGALTILIILILSMPDTDLRTDGALAQKHGMDDLLIVSAYMNSEEVEIVKDVNVLFGKNYEIEKTENKIILRTKKYSHEILVS